MSLAMSQDWLAVAVLGGVAVPDVDDEFVSLANILRGRQKDIVPTVSQSRSAILASLPDIGVEQGSSKLMKSAAVFLHHVSYKEAAPLAGACQHIIPRPH